MDGIRGTMESDEKGEKRKEKGKKKKIKKNLAKRIQYGAPYVHDRKE